MASINVINDVDKLYQGALIESDEGFRCNVCGKVYKKLKSAQDHINKKDCYNALDLFKNTQNEIGAYSLYKSVIGEFNPSARISITIFRRSPMYGSCVKTYIFCMISGLSEQMAFEYMIWAKEIKKVKTPSGVFTFCRSDEWLSNFRAFCRVNQTILIDSARFYNKYTEDLQEDHLFLVRSLEKANIGLLYLLDNAEWFTSEFIENMAFDYQERIFSLMDELR